MLTDRTWNQCQAALAFWNRMERLSPGQAIQMSGVKEFFQGDRPSPLTQEEIDALIQTDPVADRCQGYPLREMAGRCGITPRRLTLSLRRLGKTPVGQAGRTDLWSWEDLYQAADQVLQRDRTWKAKYVPQA
jgi:hypothetical protein